MAVYNCEKSDLDCQAHWERGFGIGGLAVEELEAEEGDGKAEERLQPWRTEFLLARSSIPVALFSRCSLKPLSIGKESDDKSTAR
jgi:hypothetical protein